MNDMLIRQVRQETVPVYIQIKSLCFEPSETAEYEKITGFINA